MYDFVCDELHGSSESGTGMEKHRYMELVTDHMPRFWAVHEGRY